MDKKIVLYLGPEGNNLISVATMLAEQEIDVECAIVENTQNFPMLWDLIQHLSSDNVIYSGIIVDLGLKRKDGVNGHEFLKLCRQSPMQRVSKMPKVLIVDDETLDLTEQQMEEIRQYQFGLLYKPYFDGRHIVQLLFH